MTTFLCLRKVIYKAKEEIFQDLFSKESFQQIYKLLKEGKFSEESFQQRRTMRCIAGLIHSCLCEATGKNVIEYSNIRQSMSPISIRTFVGNLGYKFFIQINLNICLCNFLHKYIWIIFHESLTRKKNSLFEEKYFIFGAMCRVYILFFLGNFLS